MSAMWRDATVRDALAGGCLLVACIWLGYVLLMPLSGWSFALVPRTADGLLGVVGMPLLHANVAHLWSNSVPLAILGGLVGRRGLPYLGLVTALCLLLGGLLLWCLGRPALHVGASLLVFGYLGFLLGRGYLERSWEALIVAVIVLVAYGGLFWGVLPNQPGVSWEGHLFGVTAGLLTARLMAIGTVNATE